MDASVAALVFYLGLAEVLLSAYLFYIAYSAMRKAEGKSFYKTMRVLAVAILLFLTMQAVSKLHLMHPDLLGIMDAISSILLVLLLIAALNELGKAMLAHEHLARRKHHGKRDVE